MSDQVRMGVVGAGTISLRGILPHLSQEDVQDRVVLEAVVDPVPGRAESAAARYGVARAYTDFADLLSPPLTVVRWNNGEVGRIAADILLSRIEERARDEPIQVVLPSELVIRGSCAPWHEV